VTEILHESKNAKSNNIKKDANDVHKMMVQSEKNN
jgi:hypothetical protein